LLPQLAAMTADASGADGAGDFIAREYARLEGAAFNGFAAELSPDAVAYLLSLPFIDVVEPDVVVRGVALPGERRAQQTSPTPLPARGAFDQPSPPWHLDRVDERARTTSREYSYTNTGEGVDVYILDSGINLEHRDFTGRIAPGANLAEDIAPDDITDCNGHGCVCRVCAAAQRWCAARVYSGTRARRAIASACAGRTSPAWRLARRTASRSARLSFPSASTTAATRVLSARRWRASTGRWLACAPPAAAPSSTCPSAAIARGR